MYIGTSCPKHQSNRCLQIVPSCQTTQQHIPNYCSLNSVTKWATTCLSTDRCICISHSSNWGIKSSGCCVVEWVLPDIMKDRIPSSSRVNQSQTFKDEDAKIFWNVRYHPPMIQCHIPDFNPHPTADWEQVEMK